MAHLISINTPSTKLSKDQKYKLLHSCKLNPTDYNVHFLLSMSQQTTSILLLYNFSFCNVFGLLIRDFNKLSLALVLYYDDAYLFTVMSIAERKTSIQSLKINTKPK